MKKYLVFSLIVCLGALTIGIAMAGSSNGRAGTTPAYYDAELFTVNLMHLPAEAAASVIAHNKSINIIYRSEGTIVPGQGPWIDVLDAVPGDGFNPLWQEVTVTFKTGVTPYQLFSDDDIIAAATEPGATITLTTTDEVYRCSVIGPPNVEPQSVGGLGIVMASSTNGRAGTTPAYYDADLFTVNLMHLPANAAANLIAHNKSINIIYRSEGTIVPGQGPWIDVLDAIQGDGFNPLWLEVTVTFKTGVTPYQLFSDDQVTAAATEPGATITLTLTNELYRCSVIGPKI